MFIALLDACVLYPAALRDTLLRAALRGLYRPQWSAQIIDEVSRNPDTFLVHLFHRAPEIFVEVLREQAAALRKPSTPFERVLETLEKQVPIFVSRVRHYLQDDAAFGER